MTAANLHATFGGQFVVPTDVDASATVGVPT
jgi:hypothetical protein